MDTCQCQAGTVTEGDETIVQGAWFTFRLSESWNVN